MSYLYTDVIEFLNLFFCHCITYQNFCYKKFIKERETYLMNTIRL